MEDKKVIEEQKGDKVELFNQRRVDIFEVVFMGKKYIVEIGNDDLDISETDYLITEKETDKIIPIDEELGSEIISFTENNR